MQKNVMNNGVLAKYIVNKTHVIMTSVFRMVAERVHQLQQRLLYGRVAQQEGQVHLREQLASLGQVPSNYLVNSTLCVTPILDPHSGSTMTWSTSTRCSGEINMLIVPKQQPHRRKLHTVLEGNKPDQQSGSMTTFRNWAAKVQIYMSLEDHKLAT
eukprot:3334040-Amphidinium_carterae.1